MAVGALGGKPYCSKHHLEYLGVDKASLRLFVFICLKCGRTLMYYKWGVYSMIQDHKPYVEAYRVT